jgi:hypothetical protein
MFARSFFVALGLLLVVGCNSETKTTPPASSMSGPSEDVVAVVEPAGPLTRRLQLLPSRR